MKFFKTLLLLAFIINCSLCAKAVSKCDQHHWRCNNGDCIDFTNLCDGRPDCLDGSDETAEHCIHVWCPSFAYRCAYGACIPGVAKCDGFVNCADGSDEMSFLCNRNTTDVTLQIKGKCSEVQCKSNDQCIQSHELCDGIRDCADGSDETVEYCSHIYCPLYAFRCGYGGCIKGISKCNGVPECLDGSDEATLLCHKNIQFLYNKTHDFDLLKPVIHQVHHTTKPPYAITITPNVIKPKLKGCHLPPYDKHLLVQNSISKEYLKAGAQVPDGVSVTYECFYHWTLQGSDYSTCLNGVWTNQTPYCINYCSPQTLMRGISTVSSCDYSGESISCKRELPINSTARIKCAPGYKRSIFEKDEQDLLTCDEDAEWNYPKFYCVAKCGKDVTIVQSDGVAKKPWDVSIYRRTYDPLFEWRCSGIILSPKIIITASSCFTNRIDEFPPNHIFYNVVEGAYTESYNQQDLIGDGNTHNISEIMQPLHSPNDQYRTLDDDIALLVLVDYLNFGTAKIQPICFQAQQFASFETVSGDNIKVGSLTGFKRRKDQKVLLAAIAGGELPNGNKRQISVDFFRTFIDYAIKRYNYLL